MISSAHLIFFVREQAASARLYSAILDRPPTLDVPGMTEFTLCGGAVLGLMPSAGIRRLLPIADPESASGIPRAELYLVVDDAGATYERAVAAGARVLSAVSERDWGDRAGYVADPDGHVIAFAERALVGTR